MYQARRRLGGPIQRVPSAEQPHKLDPLSCQLDCLERHLGWFGKYLR